MLSQLSELEALPVVIVVAGLYVLLLGAYIVMGRGRITPSKPTAANLPAQTEAPTGASRKDAPQVPITGSITASLLSGASPAAISGGYLPNGDVEAPTPISCDPGMIAPGGVLCPQYFLENYTRDCPGSRLGASRLHAKYNSHARYLNLKYVSPRGLGRTARALGWRTIKSSSIYYRDKAFVWQ